MTSPSFRSNWAEMSLPPDQDALTGGPVNGTNAYLGPKITMDR